MFGLRKRPRHRLDRRVLRWTLQDELTERGLRNGGILILGRPGSGKTSSSGKAIGRAILGIPDSGGLILGASPSDLPMWEGLFRAAGRSKDLVVFGPRHRHAFNLVAFLLRLGIDSRGIAKAIITIGEALDNDDSRSGGGDGDKFWTIQTRAFLEAAVILVKLGTGTVTVPLIQQFLSTAASSPEEIGTLEWGDSFHSKCVRAAQERPKTPIEQHDFALARTEWLRRWPDMNSRTRTSIEASIAGILSVFCSGMVYQLLSGGTTITPEIMLRGGWIFVDASVGALGPSGAFILNALRYATQQMVLRRDDTKDLSPICIWADEAGKVVNSADSFFLSESRKFGGFTVFLAQSVASFHSALPGERGRNQADNLLNCFAHKIIHACDPMTAEWASKMCGDYREAFVSPSESGQRDLFDAFMGRANLSFSVSEQYQPRLRADTCMNGLRQGGPPDYTCDSIVIRSGERFSDGSNAIFVSWSQR